MYVSYLSEEHGMFAQYCKAQAGYYRSYPRRLRRRLEIAAHAAGRVQIPLNLLREPCVTGGYQYKQNADVAAILHEAAL